MLGHSGLRQLFCCLFVQMITFLMLKLFWKREEGIKAVPFSSLDRLLENVSKGQRTVGSSLVVLPTSHAYLLLL